MGALVALAADVVLTFVVPALAFTTASVREAFRHSVRMIGETWPRSAPYVLSPGIAALMPALMLPEAAMSFGVRTVLAVVGALLALWFKGAIAAFYLRLHPETPDDGAAYRAPPLA